MIFTTFSSPSSYSSRDLHGHTDRIEEIKDICPRGTFFCQFNTISLCTKVKYPSSRRVKGYKNKAQVKFVVLLCLIHRYTHTHTHLYTWVNTCSRRLFVNTSISCILYFSRKMKYVPETIRK